MKEIRICFQKAGRARYISHLDLTRAMTRAVRRAGLPIWYTEGFNKHPYLTFAAPLSLGAEGLRESMDLRLTDDIPMRDIVDRLNAVLPEGLTALSAAEPLHKAGELAAARYRLTFTGELSYMADFLAQNSILAEKRTKKGGVKQIDLKPALQKAACTPEEKGALVMEIFLPCSSAETINPALIVSAYNAFAKERGGVDGAANCRIVRTALYCGEGVPFA